MGKTIDRTALASELAGLPTLPIAVLRQRWAESYGSTPPDRIGRVFLIRAIAHRLQEKALGALKPSLRRLLSQLAEDAAGGKDVAPPLVIAKPGTRLIRQWQGRTHEVTVAEDGVFYDGRSYRSLSAVAAAITGTHWSGPRFFGLK
jgi:Protein of unknown function (DUF2924)